jgi:hypothetical protein
VLEECASTEGTLFRVRGEPKVIEDLRERIDQAQVTR